MEQEAKYKVMWKVGSEGQYLGSLKWPPRSYCCSFCSREFRSAQALGGHMNVHRRDRARLKQLNKRSPIRPDEDFNLDHVPINHSNPTHKLITWVGATSSSSGSGSEGEQVLKMQKLCGDLTEKEDDQDSDDLNPASFKHNIQKVADAKELNVATEDLELELRL